MSAPHTLTLATLLVLVGCQATRPANPSFDIGYSGAKRDFVRMREDPIAFERPVVFIGPFLDPFVAETRVIRRLRPIMTDERYLGVSFNAFMDFDGCRQRVIDRVDAAFPTDDPDETVEVDVIAFSMGGLVARYAAMPPDAERGQARRLRIARLYTISSPHLGADWAQFPAFSSLMTDMRAGSPFLARLDAALPDADYELFTYVRLGDRVVGTPNTAPQGVTPWWTPNLPFRAGHLAAGSDARILGDIARRLRDETPWTTDPPFPLPED